ncbi:hypothetical protein JQ636_37970 [Bradyrhizobium japonicum]|uniref:hypothetical protein n=1 Tax=Bradyrhizobium japonicum TaxID=375 RepID=UPI001BAA60FC|nr:hypothetical protein [Bradyrhizobium japonicum]MBR0809351.1 hypothetical protein [Bradyrhizobium japonicum]
MSDVVNVYEIATVIHEAVYEIECLPDDDDRMKQRMTFWDLVRQSVQKRYPALSEKQFDAAFAIAAEQKQIATDQGIPVMQIATQALRQHTLN